MPPNIVDPPMHDPESAVDNAKVGVAPPTAAPVSQGINGLKLFYAILNTLTHVLLGGSVGMAIIFAIRVGFPGATPLHIVLCVVGYQVLMAQAILTLSPHNTWTAHLSLLHKRRLHWVMQILGSGLAIVGSFIKILDKTVHWNTFHGQFALVALVFTVVSLVNGLSSLYAYELRKCIPSTLSKLTHICFGTVAFATASISLCYGFNKTSFRNWATLEATFTVIGGTVAFTALIIITPLLTFLQKTKNVVSK